MINILRNKIRMSSIKGEIEMARLDNLLEEQKQWSRIIQEASNVYIDDETKFDPITYSGDTLLAEDIITLQKNGYRYWRTNALVHGWIELAVSFITGAELDWKSLDEDPLTQQVWSDFSRASRMKLRSMEIVRRTLREGECFIRLFPIPPAADNETPNGGLTIRFLDPLRVKPSLDNPQGSSYGIETNPADVEEVIAYYYDETGQNDIVRIPAEEVIHIKRADSDAKRGLPWLQPIFREVNELKKLFFARQLLHRIRASVIIDQEMRGTPNIAQSAAESQKATTDSGTGVNANTKFKTPPIGGIFIHNDNVKRTYQTPNLQAIDADADIRRHLLNCAVMMGWAEYATSADASNSNYASTMIAESPFVKTLLREQAFFSVGFEKLHEAVIRRNIELGLLPEVSRRTSRVRQGDKIVEKVETIPRPLGANISYPNLIHRDFLQETQALILQRDTGALSLHTMQVKLELDPQEERLNLDIEAMERGNEDDANVAGATNKADPALAGLDDAPAANEPRNRKKTRTRPTNR